MVNYEKLGQSLRQLERQFANHLAAKNRAVLTELDREAIAESVIQRFETCYDTLWKTLKRHMIETLGLPDVPNSPKPLFKHAAQNGLLSDRVEAWLRYADARTATAHDYSLDKAQEALDLIEDFLHDASCLVDAMTRKPAP
jgi:nucleotidyltransferase substrate binding protein (TIGR01987 family)